MYSRNISRSKIALNPLHSDRAFIPKLRYATHGDFPHGRVKETVAKTDIWQQSQDELVAHIEEQAQAVAPVQRYRTPAERGIPSMRMERRSDEEIRADMEEFLSRPRGAVVLADGTVAVDHEFYRMMGSVSQFRGRGMRELRKKA